MRSLQLPKPHLIVVVGIPGSGKTAFAKKFSDTFGAPFINARKLGTDRELAYELLREVMKTRATVVYENDSGTRRSRSEISKLARDGGYEPLFVWVQTDAATAHMRATRRTKTNPYAITNEEFDLSLAGFSPLHVSEKPAVISGKHTYASQAKVVLKRLTNDAGRSSTGVQSAPRAQADVSVRRSVVVR